MKNRETITVLNHRTMSYEKREVFSILKASEGGTGFELARALLRDAGIGDVRREHVPYVGHVGLSVPASLRRRAAKVLF